MELESVSHITWLFIVTAGFTWTHYELIKYYKRLGEVWYAKIWGWPEDFENLTENPSGTQNMGTHSPDEIFFPSKIVLYVYLNAEDCVLWI